MTNERKAHYILWGTIWTLILIVLVFNGVASSRSAVVVNVPADYKPLATMPKDTKVLANEKAILWWTVYSAAIDHHREYPTSDATQAIQAVYGDK